MILSASEVTSKNVSNVQRRKCSQTGNDPKTGNYPQTESDHQNGNDPRCGLQMILPESVEWHKVWFPGFFNFGIKLDLVKHLIIKRSEKSFTQRFHDSRSSFSSEQNKN